MLLLWVFNKHRAILQKVGFGYLRSSNLIPTQMNLELTGPTEILSLLARRKVVLKSILTWLMKVFLTDIWKFNKLL